MTLEFRGPYGHYDVYLVLGQYENGRIGISAVCADDFSPAFNATVNLPDQEVAPDEAFIKDYSENEGVLKFLQDAGIVKEIVRKVRSGYVSIPLCKLNMKRLNEVAE